MTRVSPRARRFRDRAGDPLDGLVNLFDVGIVLAVAFLLAALASPMITRKLSDGRTAQPGPSVPVRPGEVLRTVPTDVSPAAGYGTPVGRVYRQRDGRLIYVVPRSALPGTPATPSPTPTPTHTR